MTTPLKKLLAPEMRWKSITLFAIIVICMALLGMQVNRWLIASRMVTQVQIEAGWKAAGLEIATHTIAHKENFWKVAKQYQVNIDSIIGANQGLAKLSAAAGQKIRVPNQRGVVHLVEAGDSAVTIAELYSVPVASISALNNLRPKHILVPGREVFIPKAKPVRLSEDMTAQYSLRGIFGSPLPGRITSGMGMRKHPVGGFRGRHTGLDLAASPGTRIDAAAPGTVLQTGEGEYIGKFVILGHKDSYTTIYGHCSEILTTAGKSVKKGQVIAKVGNTGRTTGPHLHFEIRKNGIPQNPLSYLW
jgi:LysM repeat protein